ncbi:MAG: 50S ribosomal protein L11 methyltransferase [Magnetococcales bacterium]|nr:50S ribosomal protein L11 methyltransferase [Magnetococcales bacterium]
MVWEVRVLAPEGREELCAALLDDVGSLGSVMEWGPEAQSRVWVKGYFPDAIQRDECELRLRLALAGRQLHLEGEAGMQWRHLVDEDWAEAWKKDWRPFPVGERFLIRPSWWSQEASSRLVLRVDPGLAFGSGTHETTSGCLEAMEWVAAQRPLGALLDMGCGSGILAMGAALLEAQSVTACDLDPQAIEVCRENCELNGIQGITTVLSQKVPPGPHDTIVANILSGVLLDLADGLLRELVRGGYLILSGLLEQQLQEILVAYKGRGMIEQKILPKPPWVTVILLAPK